jgi:CO dehydrogenase/acetyl-CoA synthase alpha subunit
LANDRAELGQIADALRRKGVPPVLATVPEIVYCLFVPKAEDGVREVDGMMIVDAAAVVVAGI